MDPVFGAAAAAGTAWFGILSMVIVGSSWCLMGLVMGDAPKKKIEPSLVQFFGSGFSALVSFIIMLATSGAPECSWKITAAVCGTYALSGMMNFTMLQFMSRAMQMGPNGIIWSIIQSALVFPFLIGILFFGVAPTIPRIIGIVLILAALALFGLAKNNVYKGGSRWRRLAFLCLGICAVQQNLMMLPSYFEEAKAVGSIVRTLATAGGTFLGAVIYNLVQMTPERFQKLRRNTLNPMLWKYVGAVQFFGLIFSYTLFYPGMNAMAEAGMGSLCYPMLIGSCILSFTAASAKLLKEKISPLQLAGTAVCLAGLISLCIPA